MLILIWLLLFTASAFAQESILLNVNQTHTLQWDWQRGDEGPLRTFVFQCQQYRKELEADARSLRFGNLIDQPGRYTGCTLLAKNEAGLSRPVVVPDFEYTYSYQRLGIWLVEWLAFALAAATVARVSIISLLGWTWHRQVHTPLALPEPSIILDKEHDHADRYY